MAIRKKFRARGYLAVAFLVCLSACGGAGDPMTIPTPTPPTNPTGPSTTGPQMRADAVAMIASHTNPVSYTPLSQLPLGGSPYTYNGFFFGDLANTSDGIADNLIGRMQLQITFNATSASVSGTVDQFVDDNNDALTGQLTFSAGSLDRTGSTGANATFEATANGQLTELDGDVLTINTALEGDFIGATFPAVGGDVFGGVTTLGGTQNFDGGFVAER